MDWVAKQGKGAALELADTVRWSLLNPRHLFRGIRDDDDRNVVDGDHWLCYVASPGHAYDWRRGSRVNAWEDEVFHVYVTDERVVYLWYWGACDPDDPRLPWQWQDRFREQVF